MSEDIDNLAKGIAAAWGITIGLIIAITVVMEIF